MKQSQPFDPRHKTTDRNTENGFIDRSNGKFSFLIEEDNGGKSNKTYRLSINNRPISKGN